MEYTLKLNEKELRRYRHQLYNAVGELGGNDGTVKVLKELAERLEGLMDEQKELVRDVAKIVSKSADDMGMLAKTEMYNRKDLGSEPIFIGWHCEVVDHNGFDELCKSAGFSGLIEGDPEKYFPANLSAFGKKLKENVIYWYNLSRQGVVMDNLKYEYDRKADVFKLKLVKE